MIALVVVWLGVSLGIFVLLRRTRLVVRLLIAVAVFVLLAGMSLLFLTRIGDPPPEGSVPVTQEFLQRGAVSQEEWDEYVRQQEQQLEETDNSGEAPESPAESP
jgi:hypothetical protein